MFGAATACQIVNSHSITLPYSLQQYALLCTVAQWGNAGLAIE